MMMAWTESVDVMNDQDQDWSLMSFNAAAPEISPHQKSASLLFVSNSHCDVALNYYSQLNL